LSLWSKPPLGISEKDCRAQPRNGMQICTGFSDTQTGGLLEASRFDTGPRQAGT
jgi:hypothetical protein